MLRIRKLLRTESFEEDRKRNLLLAAKAAQREKESQLASELIRAAKKDKLDTVEMLLSQGSPLTAHHEHTGYYALHYAVSNENLLMIETLIKHGADPRQKSQEVGGHKRITPIQLAAKNDLVTLLRYLIENAYADTESGIAKPNASFTEKTLALGSETTIALAECVINDYTNVHARHGVDIPLLIKRVLSIVLNSNKDRKAFCYQIGQFLFSDNKIESALLFFVLAENHADASQLKAKCYYMLLGDNTPQDTETLSLPLAKQFNEDDFKHLAKDTPILNNLLENSTKSASICNELGEIYDVLDDRKNCYAFLKQGAWLGSLASVAQLSNLSEKMPEKKSALAKYKAVCCYLGIGGKKKNKSKALSYIKKSIRTDLNETLSYLVTANIAFSILLLNDENFIKKNNEFAIQLFNREQMQCELSDKDKARFLIASMTYNPKHPLTEWENFISSLPKKPLFNELKRMFLIVNLLNNDTLSDSVATLAKYLRHMRLQDLNDMLKIFDSIYGNANTERVCHIVQLYQYLLSTEHPTAAEAPLTLDWQGSRHLSQLIKGDKTVKHQHRIQKIVQEIALPEIAQLLESCEDPSQRKETMNEILGDPLVNKHHTFSLNPMRLLPTSSVRKLKEQFKEENENESNYIIKK